MTILAYHGTDRLDFMRLRLRKASASQVDIAEARPFNIGLHFGTRAAALSRIDYLCENGRAASMRPPHFRLLTCKLTLNNPFRIDDVFGHSYGFLLAALESELGRAASMRPPREPRLLPLAALQRRFDRLTARWLAADDNPRLRLRTASAPQVQKDPSLYAAFNARMNVSIRRPFRVFNFMQSSDRAEWHVCSDRYMV